MAHTAKKIARPKHKRSSVRDLYYEAKPFLVATAGIWAASLNGFAGLQKLAAFVLVLSAFSIFYMRARYRGIIR